MLEEIYESQIVLNRKANELTLEPAYAIGVLHEHRGRPAEAEWVSHLEVSLLFKFTLANRTCSGNGLFGLSNSGT